jgi:hypothetical protein
MTEWTHSSIVAFQECPVQGLDSLGPRVSKVGPSRQGQWLHAVGHRYQQWCFDNRTSSDMDYGIDLVARLKGMLTPEDQLGAVEAALKWLGWYDADWLLEFSHLMLEQRVHCSLDGETVYPDPSKLPPGEDYFALTADLAGVDEHDRLNIGDLKSGRNVKHVRHPSTNQQLRRYARPLLDDDIEQVLLHVEHMRHLARETVIVPAEEVIHDWRELVIEPVKRFRKYVTGEAEAIHTIGPHCGDCDIRGACPAYERFPGEVDHLNGEELVAAKAVLKSKNQAVNDRLKVLIEEQGTLGDGTHEASIRITDKVTEWDVEKFAAILREVLPDSSIPVVMSRTKTGILKLLQDNQMKPEQRMAVWDRLVAEAGTVEKHATLEVKRASVREEEDEEQSD